MDTDDQWRTNAIAIISDLLDFIATRRGRPRFDLNTPYKCILCGEIFYQRVGRVIDTAFCPNHNNNWS